jgi:hypothetical protein
MNGDRLEDLSVAVDEAPDPGQIRPAISAALTGLPWPAGPEHDIAAAVVKAVRTHHDQQDSSPAAMP